MKAGNAMQCGRAGFRLPDESFPSSIRHTNGKRFCGPFMAVPFKSHEHRHLLDNVFNEVDIIALHTRDL